MPRFIATCAKGLEYVLVDELKALDIESPKEGLSQVQFETDWRGVYQVLMWSRVASRVLYPIATFNAEDEDTLYQQASIIDWSQHLKNNASFVVNAQSYRSNLSHTQYIAQRVKDAVVDYFRDAGESRPDVEFNRPDVAIHCRIRRNQVTLSIDLAGEGLHHRGYRTQGGSAPIKENLAAALLIRAGWPKQFKRIYDPMCGSGTFLVEAAMMAFNIAPGLKREYLGLTGWNQFNPALWDSIVAEANQSKAAGLAASDYVIEGSDQNPKAVRSAQANIGLAELEDKINIQIAAIDQLADKDFSQPGLLIVNPPYSERLGERNQVIELYSELGELLKHKFNQWRASVLSPDKAFGHALGIRAEKIYKFNNGSIACELLNLNIDESKFLKQANKNEVDKDFSAKLSEQAIQLSNRLIKNRAKIKKYLAKEGITCYRVYDADLPEYNAAIDVYENKLHIQEYKPPKSIDEATANRRLKDIQRVAAGVFEIPLSHVFVKQRRQQKGDWQYQKSAKDNQRKVENYFTVVEAGRKLEVNLIDYLDTGLFLDHRNTRQMIAAKAAGKSVLNLFCYTASISVYAATAGAKKTTNVDMSRTYLEWAKRNFCLNKINLSKHEFVRENCIEWIDSMQNSDEKFDVIFLDPPTFSNSKKMETHFDVQEAHVDLIEKCLNLLSDGGTLYFSNNFTKFEMKYKPDVGVAMKEISKQTQAPDFNRKNLHRCWEIVKHK
ncbi:bifunctional 23S rRNA (guanine(2069)-N(7))-methyltransferase RlmK/23S rRNA (guanine(2445)-N(2))-methyltransferase RlmL [Aliikangiella sp. IMCC44632]